MRTAAAVPDQWLGLVALLEPVKWYGRLLGEDVLNARLAGREMPLARPYDVDSPLDRVIDGLFAESPMARDLVGVCERASAGDAAARLRIAQLAGDWGAIAAQRDCPEELAPSAARLGQVSAWLSTYLGGAAGAAGAAATLAKLQALDLAQGEYVLALVPLLCDWLEREST